MKIILPVKTKDEFVGGRRVVEYGDKTFDLDMSLAAQMRWEKRFPTLAEKEDLVSYTERVKQNESLSAPVILSKLKTLYCYFDTELGFIQFLQMFDFTNKSYTERLINKISEALQAITDEATEKN